MTVPQEHRDRYRLEYRRLVEEMAACAADPRRDVAALKAIAFRGREGWLTPTADREDGWAWIAIRTSADGYAHQGSVRRRAAMGPALAVLARIGAEILDASEPPAPATAPKHWQDRED